MNGVLPGDNSIWLRMTKQGYTYATSYSLDGTKWVPVWSTGATLTNVKAGLFAYGGAATTTNLQVAFDFFHVSNASRQSFGPLRRLGAFRRARPAARGQAAAVGRQRSRRRVPLR
jgi:Tfp pilus tip-associated adhesin PilY1